MRPVILIGLIVINTFFLGFTSTRLWAEYLFSTSQWRESIAANPYDWKHRYELAWALMQRGQTREAAYHFARVLRDAPGNFDAANNLGVALERMGHRDKAIEVFKAILRMWPEHKEARENLGVLSD